LPAPPAVESRRLLKGGTLQPHAAPEESGAAELVSGTFIVLRILVVDDDASVSGAIAAFLRRPGLEVAVADGPEEGMRVLAKFAFDLMLVDIFMPKMRGYQSIRVFHERAPTTPLIAMSGHHFSKLSTSSDDFLETTRQLGATRFLRKPFTQSALVSAVNECLAAPRGAIRP
jgi:CheY-like chemotaxis protein